MHVYTCIRICIVYMVLYIHVFLYLHVRVDIQLHTCRPADEGFWKKLFLCDLLLCPQRIALRDCCALLAEALVTVLR